MEARAMYDFRAQQEDELSFQRNDILKILQTDEVKYFLLMIMLNDLRENRDF